MDQKKLFDSRTVFLAALICLATLFLTFQLRSRGRSASAELDVETIQKHAQDLQNNQLFELAAAEYGRLGESALLPRQKRANINFIRGKLYLEKIHDYKKALASFLRAKQDDEAKKLTRATDKLIVETLEKMGRRSDAQHKMAQATSLKKTAPSKGQVVAKVGSREITMRELDEAIARLPDYIQETLTSPQQKLKFLEQYVRGALMTQAAYRRGLDKDKAVRQQIDDFEKQALAEALFNQEVREKVKVSEAAIKAYFEANKEKYATFPWVQVAHIMVRDKDQAEKILARLKKGEDFTSLALKYSLDEKTKDQGGLLGVVDVGGEIPGFGVQPDIKEKLFAAKKGDFVGPLKLNDNEHIFRILYRNERQEADFDTVKLRVRNDLARIEEKRIFDGFIKELNQAQKVVIYDDLFR